MIKVLVVEDSPVVQEFLVYVLSSDPEIKIVGTANNGEEAIEAVKNSKPDVITMDIHMPKVDGFDATRNIMETCPTPIVIVSGSSSTEEVATTFRALEAGALAVVRRPAGKGHPEHAATARELVQTLKTMSEVKVVRRWPKTKGRPAVLQVPSDVRELNSRAAVGVVAIGASTGGPVVLRTILSALPRDFPIPTLIVQHMASGFIQGFAEWLAQSSRYSVHVADDGECILPAHAYVAPDGFHLGVKVGGRIMLDRGEVENGSRPAISYLFRSVAGVFGQNAVAVLLTGMGKDGATGLKLLKEKGALTVAQDEESSAIHGMPGEAIRLDAATLVLPPDKISELLVNLSNQRAKDSAK